MKRFTVYKMYLPETISKLEWCPTDLIIEAKDINDAEKKVERLYRKAGFHHMILKVIEIL